MDPFRTLLREYDKMIFKLAGRMNAQKRYEKLDNITGRCGIDLQSNHTWMFAKREDYPITKMFIKSN